MPDSARDRKYSVAPKNSQASVVPEQVSKIGTDIAVGGIGGLTSTGINESVIKQPKRMRAKDMPGAN